MNTKPIKTKKHSNHNETEFGWFQSAFQPLCVSFRSFGTFIQISELHHNKYTVQLLKCNRHYQAMYRIFVVHKMRLNPNWNALQFLTFVPVAPQLLEVFAQKGLHVKIRLNFTGRGILKTSEILLHLFKLFYHFYFARGKELGQHDLISLSVRQCD